ATVPSTFGQAKPASVATRLTLRAGGGKVIMQGAHRGRAPGGTSCPAESHPWPLRARASEELRTERRTGTPRRRRTHPPDPARPGHRPARVERHLPALPRRLAAARPADVPGRLLV